MKLLVQPGSGLAPVISAIKGATSRIDIIIFRFDVKEVQRALDKMGNIPIDIEPKFTKCGKKGADIRPNFPKARMGTG